MDVQRAQSNNKKFKQLTEMTMIDLSKILKLQEPIVKKDCVIDTSIMPNTQSKIDTNTQVGQLGQIGGSSEQKEINIVEDGHGGIQIIMNNANLHLHQNIVQALQKHFSQNN